MTRECDISTLRLGEQRPLTIIAGPCVLEAPQINERIGETLRECCAANGLQFIYKASYDKANRSSIDSPRGPGLRDGLKELARLRETLGVPITTDIHQPDHAGPAGEVVDLVQIPAFLSRQTDLLRAAAETGRAVNVKKGQFMSPAEMRHVIRKLQEAGCPNIMLTERGTFFGYHRLVNDFIGLGDLMDLGHVVCFDVTHSTQLPGAGQSTTTGRPDRAALLVRAATAAGVDALFIECHPEPESAVSDASTAQSLSAMPDLLAQVAAIREVIRERAPVADGP